MVSKVTDVKLRRGQRVRLETPGGGGWGDPMQRDPARVCQDVWQGLVSVAAARRDYGVAVTDDGRLDAEATASLRRETAA
jgi:N-methylhydantoinase B